MLSSHRLFKFIVVGIIATLVHVVIAAGLIETGPQLAPGNANSLAFLVATTFSYVGNTKWSFSGNFGKRNALRFAITAGVGCILAYSLSTLADSFGLHYLVGIGFVVVCVPALSFIAHSLWTFRSDEGPSS